MMAKVNQMTVKLKLTGEMADKAIKALSDFPGVDKVERKSPQKLRIIYDVTHTDWATLRERLQGVGAHTQTSMLSSWRDAWREFLEQNMRDNLRHKPACCSKAPAGGGLRSRNTHEN